MEAYAYLALLRAGRAPEADADLLLRTLALLERARPGEEPARTHRVALLAELARVALNAFQRRGGADMLRVSVAAGRAALACGPTGPLRFATSNNLALALKAVAEGTGDAGDLEGAVEAAREAARTVPLDDPDRCAVLLNHAVLVHRRGLGSGSGADLEDAVRLGRAALAAAPQNSPHLATIRSSLAAFERNLASRAAASGADHDRLLGELRQALREMPREHPDRALTQWRLAAALGDLHRTGGDTAALREAVGILRTALPLLPDDHPDRARIAGELAVLLVEHHRAGADDAALDEAVTLTQAAATALDGHPALFGAAANLGAALHERYRRHGRRPDLTAAGRWCSTAVRLAREGDPGRAPALVNLAAVQVSESVLGADPELLGTAVVQLRAAVASAATDAVRADARAGLALALQRVFLASGRSRDLAAALVAARRAVRSAAPGSPRRARFLGILCSLLRTRYETAGREADLARAVELADEALAASRPGSREAARHASLLGLALMRRFDRNGAEEDLTAAVALAREAARSTPEGATDRPGLLHNLANALRVRFESDRELADLDQAVTLARAVAGPTGDVRRPRRLANLGALLVRRFEATGDRRDIDEAIEVNRQAVEASTGTPLTLPGYLSDLALSYFRRYELLEEPGDLAAAVDTGRVCLSAAAAAGATAADLAGFRSNTVAPLLALHASQGRDEDLAEALRLGQAAVDGVPAGHPGRAPFLLNLARALDRAAAGLPHGPMAERAVRAYAQCAAAETATPLWRAAAAQSQAACEVRRDRWQAADAALSGAVGLLPRVAHRALARVSGQAQLRRLAGLGSDAAAVAVELGDPPRALALLEQARGVLLGQGLDYRTEPGAYPAAVADELDRLRRVLSIDVPPAGSSGDEPGAGLPLADPLAPRRDAARAWEALTGGRPRVAAAVPVADGAGVLVAVNVSRHRCDALMARGTDVRALPLPDLDFAKAAGWATAVLDAVRDDDWTTAGRLRTVLAELWEDVTEPVLRALGLTGPPPPGQPWPRITWMPTGPLALLPLHAAGHHDGPADAGSSVMDRAVSSYTPTARILRYADGRPAAGGGRLLAVGVTQAPGARRLEHAVPEAHAVHRLLGRPGSPCADRDATRAAVLAALPGSDWAHFACHSVTDPADPSAGALLLHDGPLRIRDLADGDLTGAHLAYLSSCSSAFGGAGLPDESLHIAAAFQLIGFRHVIGTLWPVGDQWSLEVAERLYPLLADDRRTPADALHRAVRELRRRYPANPRLWASHLHFGR
ncbi:CHAT domain-containing protein [Actinacidiphila paucisporea]|uniref:CHAT domain-containing protein n=1 Tax=Actinacidiphila paucisporea TaxID=310782 RepID=A0A1M7PQQ8_9ACTN|nr:CHAT domain-containing protein [Actinacidiphila paucisporea]SHN19671.1 CHAT domain-containing protein [Actinacidiphila paucisporea]